MRSTWWLLTVLLVVGCSKDPDGFADDTGDTEDTDDTATDTTDSDSEQPPEPALYGDHDAVVFDMNPVNWVPLEYTRPVYSDTVGGFDFAITIGANVTGKTDLSMTVDSHLERENDGDYAWYHTGLKDGGKLDSEMHINFPMVITFEGFSFDISALVLNETIPEANELDWVFDPHIFDTLNLTGDTESTTYIATPVHWTWLSPRFDPDEWLPFVTFELTADINLTTTFRTTRYAIHDITSDAGVATQLKAVDRGNVDSYVGELGSEPAQIRFDGKAEGELMNSLALNLNFRIYLEAQSVVTYFDFPFVFALADDAHWKITFDEERITHPKQTTAQ